MQIRVLFIDDIDKINRWDCFCLEPTDIIVSDVTSSSPLFVKVGSNNHTKRVIVSILL